ncbi:hypothetical protein GGX14DRAFT_398614 [Mycena pura]|uniref:Uncharacterized protein n=1 Tax=Mycena pura TaxID=153505 RepID=A0AAD6VAD7_9AGAR|nr:hypothetical protein GGX14DRAFT_398614 [Mycena pura]
MPDGNSALTHMRASTSSALRTRIHPARAASISAWRATRTWFVAYAGPRRGANHMHECAYVQRVAIRADHDVRGHVGRGHGREIRVGVGTIPLTPKPDRPQTWGGESEGAREWEGGCSPCPCKHASKPKRCCRTPVSIDGTSAGGASPTSRTAYYSPGLLIQERQPGARARECANQENPEWTISNICGQLPVIVNNWGIVDNCPVVYVPIIPSQLLKIGKLSRALLQIGGRIHTP